MKYIYRIIKQSLVLLAVALVLAVGVSAFRTEGLVWQGVPDREGQGGGIQSIGAKEALEYWKGKSVLFIDGREEDEYAKGHIPGSRNIPYSEMMFGTVDLSGISKTEPLVIYCYGADCTTSREMAESMELLGYSRLYVFEGGLEAWKEAGGPVETNS